MLPLYYAVKPPYILYVGIQRIYMPSYPFGVAEPFKLYRIAREPVLNEKSRRELPVIAVPAEAVNHQHDRPGAGAAPLPVEDISLFASFHVWSF